MKQTIERVTKEYSFWHERLSQILKGYRDQDIEDLLVRFVKDIDFDNLSEEEKEYILSQELT